MDPRLGVRRLRDPRVGPTARAGQIVGRPVTVAVPLQHHPPGRVLASCAAELACFAVLVLTGSLAALAAVAAVAALLFGLAATNRRRLLAVTRLGSVELDATLRGKPTTVIGPAPDALVLPAPHGVGVPVELADGRWWVDRSHYPRLRRAREALEEAAPGGATAGE